MPEDSHLPISGPRFAFARRAGLLAFAALLLTWATPRAGFAAARDLQAHGSDERLWFSRAEAAPPAGVGSRNPPAAVTTIYFREKFKSQWHRLPPIGARIAGLASRGGQLAVLLENGDWRLVTDTGFASGRPLHDGARMVALGSDAGSLWAVARTAASSAAAVEPGASSKPSTPRAGRAPSPTATRPTTATAPSGAERHLLMRLEASGWEEQAELPRQIETSDGTPISLGISKGVPFVAHRPGPRVLRVFARTPDKSWEALPHIETPEDVTEFKMLGGTPSPTLWFRGASGAGRLWIRGSSEPPVLRDLDVPGNADHAVALAHGDLRLLWVESGKIMERPLAADTGLAKGDLSSWPVPAESMVPVVWRWIQVTLTGALIVAFVASLRRRREMQEIELDPAKLRLAPISTRLTAGVIDAIPVLAAVWLARPQAGDAAGADAANADLGQLITVGIGFGVYLLLTTVIEVAAGRSLGKLFTGLHVVGLDGKPAGIGARVLRNVLRVIDIPIMPLALILFSPLRQRAGDLAAGTLVVRGKGEADAERVGQGKEQQDKG